MIADILKIIRLVLGLLAIKADTRQERRKELKEALNETNTAGRITAWWDRRRVRR